MKRATLDDHNAAVSTVQLRIQHTINEFIHLEVSGSLVLLVATIAALILANSPWAEAYFRLWKTPIGFKVGNFEFFETLQHWINDFLMAFFFFVAGLEIKREVLIGELSTLRKASLPLMAALGGMVVPAAIYLALNITGEGAKRIIPSIIKTGIPQKAFTWVNRSINKGVASETTLSRVRLPILSASGPASKVPATPAPCNIARDAPANQRECPSNFRNVGR